MLPPETTHTIGPSRCSSLSAAASDSAPAPSAMVRDFSAMSRIASAVCLSVTVIAPSDTGRIEVRKLVRLCRDPRTVVRDGDDFGAERAHPIELGLRRGLDCDYRARDSERPRGISDALPRIARADRPHAARARLVRERRD